MGTKLRVMMACDDEPTLTVEFIEVVGGVEVQPADDGFPLPVWVFRGETVESMREAYAESGWHDVDTRDLAGE